MKQKTAMVTGGGRGIGRAIALELAAWGHHVTINYRSGQEAAMQTLEMIQAQGGQGQLAGFDVADQEAVQQAIEQIGAEFEIEVLVNNAGTTADGLFVMMSRDDWDSVLDTSLSGFYNLTRPVLKKMLRAKSGAIVSLSSISGIMGNRGQVNYSAAKAGIIGASKALAAEVARMGVRVNVVAPGLIETDMTQEAPKDKIKEMIPMARIGAPEEVARVVRFLCSRDASYVTGEVICVDGGMT